MFEQLVLLTAVLSGLAFARRLRRRDTGARGYLFVLAACFLLAVGAALQADRFLGVIAIAMGLLVVVVPYALELAVPMAFNRGRLRLAVALAGIRATLMLGAGLGRQQEILRGLAVLERDGVDEALRYFRTLADEAEDDAERWLINEQIVSMLFYGQRWDEGIAHYEARFPPQHAAMRPALALGLLRAYGESGKLETAAGLLRALEEGPVGADPRAGGLLSQARLTFLAYAGAASPVAAALTEPRRRVLGLSPASGALFRGIALSRAGEPTAAKEELTRVEDLAGASDDRVVEASRNALAQLAGIDTQGSADDSAEEATDGSAPVQLGDDLGTYAARVAERLESFLRAAPSSQRRTTLVATPLLMLGLAAGYLGVLALGRGGFGVLVAGGLTPELWRAGSWGRVLVGAFVSGDPIALLLSLYAVWVAGPLIEKIFGGGRLAVTGLLCGVAGLGLSAATVRDQASIVAGSSFVAFGIVVAALWTLLPGRTPTIASRARRSLAIPLLLVAAALVLSAVPGMLVSDVAPAGLAAAAVVAIVVIGIVPHHGRASRGLAWLAAPLLVLLGVAVAQVSREDVEAFAIARRDGVTVAGVFVQVPSQITPTDPRPRSRLPLAVQRGLVDEVALRGGAVVQVISAPPLEPAEPATGADAGEAAGRGEDESNATPNALLRLAPELDRELGVIDGELPPGFAAAWESLQDASGEAPDGENNGGGSDAGDTADPATGPRALRVTKLRRNGADIGLVIERTIGNAPHQRTVALVAAPGDALDHAPRLYATILHDAVAAAVP